jgi:hypothetical protein
MRALTFLALAAVAGIGFTANAPKAEAQVSVEVGVAPPEWFTGDVFIGAGPWFHGSSDFQGHVNNRFHPQHGYKGPLPKAGEKAEPAKRADSSHFKGNEVRDGRGHVVKGKK